MAGLERLGFELPSDLPIRERAALARWAEERGFEDAWTPEISDPNAFVILTAAALATTRIRLGTAIIPLGTRTVPTLAAAAASLAELAPGRVALGIGVSSQAIVEQWNGVPYARPLERARETIGALRTVLAGERTAIAGNQVRSRGFRLRRPPATPPPILLAALNEKMLELAGELADGVYLNYVPVAALGRVLEAVRRGAARGRRDTLPEIILSVPCCVTDEADGARVRFGNDLAFYLTAPAYQQALAWYGYEAEVAAARAAWATRNFAGVRAAVSPALVDGIGAFGDPERCRERLQAFADAGVGTLSITIANGDSHTTLAAFTR
jgi:probable F420-dependent oxidoreductase